MKKHRIDSVMPGSIAETLEIRPGDSLLSVNGQPIEDIFDYDFLCEDTKVTLLTENAAGERCEYGIEKREEEDIGLCFANGLMDDYRSCCNKCIFCFIDQMPPHMRETLYFKDDDSRLSFLQGNYITLTNLSEQDIERIIRYHLSPINISVHTTDPELRCRMLNNRFAGEALKKLDRLAEAGVIMNGQIVMCPGYNDGRKLEETIEALSRYLPQMESVSVVPVGLTRFRDKLTPLAPVTAEKAAETIDIVEKWQKKLYKKTGLHFIHASDEFYLLAGRELPEEERYDDYRQFENGVGMLRSLQMAFDDELDYWTEELREGGEELPERELSIATGLLAAPMLKELTARLESAFPQIRVHIYPIRNTFFGESITVSGLVTGQDLIAQLKGQPLGEELLIPMNMLRSGEDVFLDDIRVPEVSDALGVPVTAAAQDGSDLVTRILGIEEEEEEPYVNPYELKE